MTVAATLGGLYRDVVEPFFVPKKPPLVKVVDREEYLVKLVADPSKANEDRVSALRELGWNYMGERETYTELADRDLSKLMLSGSELAGLYLEEARLVGVVFATASLRGSNLVRVDFRNSDLRRVDFRDAALSGVNLSGADCSDANFLGVNMRNGSFHETKFLGATLAAVWLHLGSFRDADFRNADLRGTEFSNYGTMATELMSKGAIYHGLDIAEGPVEMARYRADLLNRKVDIRQGSILDCPFDDESFDHVVSIGCLHHTGDLGGAIERVYRLVKPGGGATIMVYHGRSYRQWCKQPWATLRETLASNDDRRAATERLRGAYDKNQSGAAAPETDFVSKQELKSLCRKFSKIDIIAENIGADLLFKRVSRPTALKYFGRWLGLDLYCRLEK